MVGGDADAATLSDCTDFRTWWRPRQPSPGVALLGRAPPSSAQWWSSDVGALPPVTRLPSVDGSEVGAGSGSLVGGDADAHSVDGADYNKSGTAAAVAQFMEYFRAEMAAQPTRAAQVATVFAHVQAMSSTKRPRGGRSDPSCTPVEAAVVHHLFAAGTQPKLVLRRLLFDAVMRWRRYMKATEEAAAAMVAVDGWCVFFGKPTLPNARVLLVGLLGLRQDFPCSEKDVTKEEAVQALKALAGHATLWRFLV